MWGWLFGGSDSPAPVPAPVPPSVPPPVAPPPTPVPVTPPSQSIMQTSIVKNVQDFGAKGDGSHDDTNAINAAIASALTAKGGTVYFPPGNYKITSSLVMHSGVNLLGEGVNRYEIDPPPASQITWGGPVGGTIVEFPSTVNGITIHGLAFSGNNLAAKGWHMQSASMSLFQHFQITDCTQIGIHIDLPDDAPLDCTNNTFQNLQITCRNGTAIQFDGNGPAKANACHNVFSNLFLVHGNRALDIGWSDNNDFIGVFCYRSNGTNYDILLRPYSTSNRFYHTEGTIEAMPQPGPPDSRYANQVFGYDQTNGQPLPLIHPGGQLYGPQMVPYT